MADVVRCGRLRWFGHLEQKGVVYCMPACGNVVVAGVRCVGRGSKTYGECVKDDMKLLGLQPEWAIFRDVWRDFMGQTSNPSLAWNRWAF